MVSTALIARSKSSADSRDTASVRPVQWRLHSDLASRSFCRHATADGFLRTCIDSVVDQSYDSLELVVSDNANEDETPEILRSYDDPRLRDIRSKSVLSVTDNWNAALTTSTGEYILMIGDDDLLLPDCCATLDRLLAMHHDPDCLSYNAYRFIAPDAIPGIETAYYGEAYFKFEPELDRPRFLEADLRRGIVRDMFRFRTRFPLTMQIAVVRRDAMDRLPNGPFQPPFPDHYALAALLLAAETWAHAPVRPLVVGVSSKSFGHFFFNAQDMGGLSYLGIRPKFDGMLPGNEVLNVLATWLLQLKADFSDELDGVEVDWPEYTIRQIWAWIQEARQSRSVAQRRPRVLRPSRVSGGPRSSGDLPSPRRSATPGACSADDTQGGPILCGAIFVASPMSPTSASSASG